MPPISPPSGEDRKAIVSLILRQCALRVDPLSGHLSKLADALDVHALTPSRWISEGRVPKKAARRLQKMFGKRLANADILTGDAADE